MKTFELQNTYHIFELLKSYRKTTKFQYRGQSDSTWKLIPKAGRSPFNKRNDKELFNQWKRRANAYIDNKSLSDIELLTIAQHTGLPTRLLDWTYNPLVAIFFACTENKEIDGAIFAYNSDTYLRVHNVDNPFNLAEGTVKMLQPNSSHSRLINQFGYFTIHNGPESELKEVNSKGEIHKIIIPSKLKEELVFMINQLGINYMTIYPDLDGLSKHLCWFYENYVYWNELPEFVASPPMG